MASLWIHRLELPEISVHVSVLSPLQRLAVDSREALLAALRPGRDGVLLQQGARRGPFLPSVWEQLHTPEAFVRELERKAGLGPADWCRPVECWRYTAQEWGD